MSDVEHARNRLSERVRLYDDELSREMMVCFDMLAALPESRSVYAGISELALAARFLTFDSGVPDCGVPMPKSKRGAVPMAHTSELIAEAGALPPGLARDAFDALAKLHGAVLEAADIQEYVDALNNARAYMMSSAFIARCARCLLGKICKVGNAG